MGLAVQTPLPATRQLLQAKIDKIMAMMKVAYMFGGMNRGGAETLLLDVFRNWRKAPYPFIGIHRKEGTMRDEFFATDPKLYQLAPAQLGYLHYLIHLRKLLKAENITIVHTQQWLDCIYAWLATIGMPVRIINTFHGLYSQSGINGLLCRLSMLMADDICFVSRYEQQWYQQRIHIADKKCHVVYNGIDFSKIDSAKPSSEFALETRRIRLAMVGNFVRERSQSVITKSIHILKQRGIVDFDFYFIGKRDEQEAWCYDKCVQYCEEHQLKNVHFLGSRGDVPELLKSMDGFVYSTEHDTFGIAVIEAIAVGLPIVVNDWPVMKEVCGTENDGIRYFQSGNAEDAADKIALLLSNLPDARTVAKENAIRIRDKYSIEKHIMNLADIYRRTTI